MPKISHTISKTDKRKLRVRSKLFGTTQRPRLTVSRSNKHTYLQVIDDQARVTLAASSDIKAKAGQPKLERAIAAAQELSKKMNSQGIKAVVFDRGGYRYHGRIKAVADALRAAGVEV